LHDDRDVRPTRAGRPVPSGQNRLLRLIDGISRICAIAAAIMVVALALLILAQIAATSLLGRGMEFAFEYGTYLLVLIVFAGAPHAMRTGGHIRVSLILNKTGPRVRRALEIACTAIALAIAVYIGVAVTRMALQSLATGSRSYLPSQTPLGCPQMLLAAAIWIFALQIAARLFRSFVADLSELDDVPDEIDGDKI
jgi:TRAP-type C4-dicarboxylate transport system permease small subunit